MQESPIKFVPAGQIQIVAKTLLIICGVYLSLMVVLKHCLGWQMYYRPEAGHGIVSGFFFAIAAITVLCLLIYFLVLNNDWLVKKILPEEEPMPCRKQKLWFITSLRVGLVFLGLILFARQIESFTLLIYSIVKLLTFEKIVMSQEPRNNLFSGQYVLQNISNIFTLIVIFFLICGAPWFVRRQTDKQFR